MYGIYLEVHLLFLHLSILYIVQFTVLFQCSPRAFHLFLQVLAMDRLVVLILDCYDMFTTSLKIVKMLISHSPDFG